MPLRIYNAHTGRTTELNQERFLSLADLRNAVSMQHNIPTDNQILMTARATQLRMANIATETELYLFDKLLLAHPSPTPPLTNPLLPLNPQPIPNITNVKPSQAELVDLFEARADWAQKLLMRAESLKLSLGYTAAEIDVIRRSVGVAMAHLRQHLANIERSFKEVVQTAVNLSQEFDSTDWHFSLRILDHLPVIDCFGGGTLSSWVDHDKVHAIQNDIEFNDQHIQDRIRDIKFVLDKVATDSEVLGRDIQASGHNDHSDENDDDPQEGIPAMLEDLHAIVNKITKDAEYIADLPSTPASMRSITRLSSLHQREYLPNISASVAELWELNRNAQSRKASIQVASLRQLHTLSVVQSRASPIRPDLTSIERELETSKASLAVLKQMDQLPLIYGSFLIESVQRAEWSQRIKSLTGEVAEEFATWKEDEQKRRSKWLKRFGSSLENFQQTFNNSINPASSVNSIYSLKNSNTSILAVELNLVGVNEQPASASVTREDVHEFIETLKHIPGTEHLHAELQEMIKELDRTNHERVTAASRRREKLFKNGSFMEQMRSSMVVSAQQRSSRQSSPELKDSLTESLAQENRMLQEKLKSYESRVRRLEDLLHRQQVQTSQGVPASVPSGSGGGYFGLVPTAATNAHPISVSRHHSAPVVNGSPQLSPGILNQSPQQQQRVQSPIPIQQQFSQLTPLPPQPRKSPPISQSPRASTFEFESSRKRGSALRLDRMSVEPSKDPSAAVADLRSEQQQLRSALESEKETSTRLKKQMHETERNMQEIEVIKQDLLANLSQQEAEFQRERKSLNQEISALKAHIYAMEEAEETLEESRVDKEGMIANLESALEEQQQRERDLEEVKSELDIEIRNLRETLRAERDESTQLASKLGESTRAQLSLKSRTMQLEELLRAHAERSDDAAEDKDGVLPYDREGLENTMKELQEVLARLADSEVKTNKFAEENESLRETMAQDKALINRLWKMMMPDSTDEEPSPETVESTLQSRLEQFADAERRLGELGEEVAALKCSLAELKASHESQSARSRDITVRLYTFYRDTRQLMNELGIVYSNSKAMVLKSNTLEEALYKILPESEREKRIAEDNGGESESAESELSIPEIDALHWTGGSEADEGLRYERFINEIEFDYQSFSKLVHKRIQEAEFIARKWYKMARLYREKARRAKKESSEKIAYKSFKSGDLALFLPTSSKVNNANHVWAAFNDGAPYCFLRDEEQNARALEGRQWMVGRITKMEEDADGVLSSSFTDEQSRSGPIAKGDQAASTAAAGEESLKTAVADGRRFIVDAVEIRNDSNADNFVPPSETPVVGRRLSALAAAAAKRTTRPAATESEVLMRPVTSSVVAQSIALMQQQPQAAAEIPLEASESAREIPETSESGIFYGASYLAAQARSPLNSPISGTDDEAASEGKISQDEARAEGGVSINDEQEEEIISSTAALQQSFGTDSGNR
ncbi:hypothetical protein BZA70DRAFT_285832 [Myxozyma melibiosi]|uniref:Autophagy-related protein 11 n=1 Tax=Myxozyma melibiosi TaxID=54550 RepID=A0ABR1EY84_9ASCO